MTTHYFPEEQMFDDYFQPAPAIRLPRLPGPPSVELTTLLLVVLVIALLVSGAIIAVKIPVGDTAVERQETPFDTPGRPSAPPLSSSGPQTFIAPYTTYAITQGIHGESYGHMAIDIAAGKGEPIHSPITGAVKELFTDGIGNTVLVIENANYKVTMLHGEYSVGIGDQVTAGFTVGSESNIGNTFDMNGKSCRNRDCGYHTHLNVYDKQLGSNVDPLELIENSGF